jgi:hypothetical protein
MIQNLKQDFTFLNARVVNRETPTKNLQMEYWQLYSEICDTSDCPDVQIVPAQKHWQYIKTGN